MYSNFSAKITTSSLLYFTYLILNICFLIFLLPETRINMINAEMHDRGTIQNIALNRNRTRFKRMEFTKQYEKKGSSGSYLPDDRNVNRK